MLDVMAAKRITSIKKERPISMGLDKIDISASQTMLNAAYHGRNSSLESTCSTVRFAGSNFSNQIKTC